MTNLTETPIWLIAGIIVCVIFPFSIYAFDVIISVNVIDTDIYRETILSDKNNFTLLPNPVHLTGNKYPIHHTIFKSIEINTRLMKNRRTRAVPDDEIIEILNETTSTFSSPTTITSAPTLASSTSEKTATTTTKTPKTSSTLKTLVITNATDAPALENSTSIDINSTELTSTTTKKRTKPAKFQPRPVATLSTTPKTTTTPSSNATVLDPEQWMQQQGEFCKGLYYFYEHHLSYAYEYGSDWMNDQTATAYQKEQALFFLFTVFGFLFLMASVALRCDIFLSDEWSSFIMIQFFLYSISMALTMSVFGQESSNDGLRCATCRFTVGCDDIDPWNNANHWPVEGTDTWLLVAELSFIFKLIDCFMIGLLTLKFIVDFNRDLWWMSVLKIVGWVIVFPLLIFTPMLGVARYQVLPGVSPDDDGLMLAAQILFFIGVAFWALALVALPIFCHLRMCSGSAEEKYEEDEEDEYEDH